MYRQYIRERMTGIDVAPYRFIDRDIETLVKSALHKITIQERAGGNAYRGVNRKPEEFVFKLLFFCMHISVSKSAERPFSVIFVVCLRGIVEWLHIIFRVL